MKTILIFLISALMTANEYNKSLRTEGFELNWEYQEDKVRFTLSAPSTGWVAIGFTEGKDIVNTNLIQGNVKGEEFFIQDQFVTGFGEHPPVEALAVPSSISDLSGQEENNRTYISFSILKDTQDKLHYNLEEGKEINVWLAYSVSDDFDHHSRKRILRRIKL